MTQRTVKGLPYDEYFVSGHRACAGCGEALIVRHIVKAAGQNTIMVCATGCMEVVSTPYPETAWMIPWIHGAFENNSAVASGIDAALKMQGRRDKANLIVLGGDGASFDIGFGALSGAMERGHKFTYVCTDNEAYANTGVQRSGATPFLANTTTSPAGKAVQFRSSLLRSRRNGRRRNRLAFSLGRRNSKAYQYSDFARSGPPKVKPLG